MPTQKLSPEIIQAAIEGFESQKRRIDEQIAELRQMLKGDHTAPSRAAESTRPRRTLSAAARKRIAAAQRARWAKVRITASASQKPSTAGDKARETAKERRGHRRKAIQS
jgi:hypothetical protein